MWSRVTHDCVRKRRIESCVWIEHIIMISQNDAKIKRSWDSLTISTITFAILNKESLLRKAYAFAKAVNAFAFHTL